jgi:hypothetical protein
MESLPNSRIATGDAGVQWLRFFDHHLKGIDTGLDSSFSTISLGEERWKVAKPGRFRDHDDALVPG